MDSHLIVSIIILFALFIARILNEKAFRTLSADKKAKLSDLFSNQRIYNLLTMALLFIIFYVIVNKHILEHTSAYLILYAFIIGFIITTNIISYQKLKDNNFPFSYIKSHLLSKSISLGSVIVFCSLALLF